ncbi:MAG: hypothetical protein B7Z51_03720 [Methyloversatilis sp. 12-65-5]|nr:MAG: hypothetical protein B7Z51_03720 [Methyloversatilis sp. 12-65-5]
MPVKSEEAGPPAAIAVGFNPALDPRGDVEHQPLADYQSDMQRLAHRPEHGDIESPNAAALMEFFRDSPHGALMTEAAAGSLEDVADEGALPHMFDDTILHLRRTGISNSIKRLTELSRQSGLTPAQQEELHRLLKEKACT